MGWVTGSIKGSHLPEIVLGSVVYYWYWLWLGIVRYVIGCTGAFGRRQENCICQNDTLTGYDSLNAI